LLFHKSLIACSIVSLLIAITEPSAPDAEESVSAVIVPKNKEVKHNYVITDDFLGQGGQQSKARDNVAAIRLVKELEHSDAMATS